MDSAFARKTRPFIVAWCIFLLLMEFFGTRFVGSGLVTKFDFRMFYAAGYIARTHPAQLYDQAREEQIQDLISSQLEIMPFYHPSYEALVYAPFSLLKYRPAYFAFIAFNMLLLMAAFFAGQTAFSSIIPLWQPRPGLMVFLFVPLLLCLVDGQDTVLVLLCSCIAWRQLESGKDLRAGCILALALLKFQVVLPFAVLLSIRCGRRFITGFVIAAAGVVLFCGAIVGPSGVMDYIRLLHSSTLPAAGISAIAQRGMGICPSTMTNLVGILYACCVHFLSSATVFKVLVDAFSFGVFLWCALVIRRVELKVAFSIAILCGLVVSYHLFIYDLTLVLLPAALLAERTQRYILLALFGLPIILLPLGGKWFFLTAVPVLAMLIYTNLFTPDVTKFTQETARAARV